jgi:Zn ribbon nucleic-acid-binding protein
MTMFRVRALDGSLRSVTAGRVVVADTELRFQSPASSGWVTVDSAALMEVARVERRFNEADGRVRWVDEREANAAAKAARPEAPPTDRPEHAEVVGQEAAAADPPSVSPAAASAPPPPAVSSRDVRCPRCGEQDELSGRRSGHEILLTCHSCGYNGPRAATRTCQTCGGDDVVERPKALVERSRGTQLSVVGYSTTVLCRICDADDLGRVSVVI